MDNPALSNWTYIVPSRLAVAWGLRGCALTRDSDTARARATSPTQFTAVACGGRPRTCSRCQWPTCNKRLGHWHTAHMIAQTTRSRSVAVGNAQTAHARPILIQAAGGGRAMPRVRPLAPCWGPCSLDLRHRTYLRRHHGTVRPSTVRAAHDLLVCAPHKSQ